MKLTDQLQRVLRVFLEDASAPRYGYELMRAASLKSGTLYPILARMEAEGLVSPQWEAEGQPGRPPRRYYQLTGEGVRVARQLLAEASFVDPCRDRGVRGGIQFPGGQPA